MSEQQRKAFDDLHVAWDAFVYEVAKALRVLQIVDWLNKTIERFHV